MTIATQLRDSFGYDDITLQTVTNQYYGHLCKIIIEISKGLQTDQDALAKHMVFTNVDLLTDHANNNQDIILMAGHYQNWEWAIGVAQSYLKHKVIGVYKPMSNPFVNDYILRRRQKHGAKLIPTQAFIKEVLTKSAQPRIFMVMTDQYPTGSMSQQTYTFLGRPTAFQCGIDKVVEKYKIPTYYADIQQIARRKYHLELRYMTMDGVYKSITQRYIQELEKSIVIRPYAWLWSHRRWRK